MKFEPEFENELPNLWERDAEIADKVLADEPRDRFIGIINQFAWLADYCDSDIEAAMCIALCAIVAPPDCSIRDYIWPQFKRARPFRVDFVIWPQGAVDRSRCIGIECDGAQYHSSARQRSMGAWRQRKILDKYGLSIIRFTGREIFADAKGCARRAVVFAAECPAANPNLFRHLNNPTLIGELITQRLADIKGVSLHGPN